MNRYFIYLGYNGKPFSGWQVQPNGVTVQQCLEGALAVLFRQPVPVVGAGRTDAGVHARLMVAHFDRLEPVDDLVVPSEKLNRLLPKEIAIYRIVPVIPEAHARFDALSRTYNYYITTLKDPFDFEYTYKLHGTIDFDEMNRACEVLYEYTDFTSFSKLHTDVKTNNCRVMQAVWEPEESRWKFTIQADRFLRNMVRAIVGTLLEVGRGKMTIDGFRQVIEAKDRNRAGMSVPGQALFLTEVCYPEQLFKVEK
ncbi:MAG: tRNA pseudouridine(38-40) synthase TruA [Massilibacteroides sp.]|nr:tRNA pseudouridine(38-40) synthase TruA [Massilibacteroides sp.]